MTIIEQIASTQPADEVVYLDGDSYYDALLDDLSKATRSIDIEMYAFINDKLGRHIAETLIAASTRGVIVRILVDGAGTPAWNTGLIRMLEKAGIKTKIFHPFPWSFWQWSRSAAPRPSLWYMLHLVLTMNSRNHRKVFTIDDKIAYIASMNIDQRHLSRDREGMGWRDTAVRISHVDITSLKTVFEHTWSGYKLLQARIQELFSSIDTQTIIRLNDSRHRRRVLYKNLLRKIARCKKRIWITNAYFVPDNFLLKKLKDSAKSGVDVRILLPRHSDVTIMPWASAAFYDTLIDAGVRIFEYLPSMLHAKTLILDDWVLVGTSNLNHRSLLHDKEVDVVIRRDANKQRIVDQFTLDLGHSEEVQPEDLPKRPLFKRIAGRFILYLKYWI